MLPCAQPGSVWSVLISVSPAPNRFGPVTRDSPSYSHVLSANLLPTIECTNSARSLRLLWLWALCVSAQWAHLFSLVRGLHQLYKIE